jgi:hypothetical protein
MKKKVLLSAVFIITVVVFSNSCSLNDNEKKIRSVYSQFIAAVNDNNTAAITQAAPFWPDLSDEEKKEHKLMFTAIAGMEHSIMYKPADKNSGTLVIFISDMNMNLLINFKKEKNRWVMLNDFSVTQTIGDVYLD